MSTQEDREWDAHNDRIADDQARGLELPCLDCGSDTEPDGLCTHGHGPLCDDCCEEADS